MDCGTRVQTNFSFSCTTHGSICMDEWECRETPVYSIRGGLPLAPREVIGTVSICFNRGLRIFRTDLRNAEDLLGQLHVERIHGRYLFFFRATAVRSSMNQFFMEHEIVIGRYIGFPSRNIFGTIEQVG